MQLQTPPSQKVVSLFALILVQPELTLDVSALPQVVFNRHGVAGAVLQTASI